jgi:hypothetical protein
MQDRRKTEEGMGVLLFLDMYLTRYAPDTDFAGYPAKPKAGDRISGKGRIQDTRYLV